MYLAPFEQDNYVINCYDPEGALIGTITREHDPIPKTQEEVQEEKDFIAFTLSSNEGGNPNFNG